MFWDTKTDDRYVKYVKNLMFIRAAGENCVLVTKAGDDSSKVSLSMNIITLSGCRFDV